VYKPALKRAKIGFTVGDFSFNSNSREVIRAAGTTIRGNDYDGGVVIDDEHRLEEARTLQDLDFWASDHLPVQFVFSVGERGNGKN